MLRPFGRRAALAFVALLVLAGMPGLTLAVHAWQSGDVFSPASGHAQVIAQGVAGLEGDVAWRVVFHSLQPGSNLELPKAGPGFVVVDTGGVVVTADKRESLLAPAEAVFSSGRGAELAPVGDRPSGVFAIDAVAPEDAADAGEGIAVFASDPFAAPAGQRDFDLVRDLLEPGDSTTVIGGETPVLVLVTLGAVSVQSSGGGDATLQVGEAATLSGDIVISAAGQAPATFVAAVIGREAPGANAAPGGTPQANVVGSVSVDVYACPPAVNPADASPETCLRDPEAVLLTLHPLSGQPEVGPSTERDGMPTWAGLPGGNYDLRAASFKNGFGRFYVAGLTAASGDGSNGLGASETAGYVVPISAEAADQQVRVFVLAPAPGQAATTPVAAESVTPIPETRPAATMAPTAAPSGPTEIPSVIQIETPEAGQQAVQPSPAATAAPVVLTETPAGPTEIPSVIQIETAVPGSQPTATPRPNPITQATVAPTARPIVTSTAVARPKSGSVEVRAWGCTASIDAFNPANCAQAVGGFEVRLVNEKGEVIPMSEATVAADGTVTWKRLPLGSYLLQQPVMLPGAATYYAPGLELADNGSGYIVTIQSNEPVAAIDVYSLPPAPTPIPPTVAPAATDTDGDGIPDADEVGIYGTDPNSADSDADGVFDGAELTNGTNPLVSDAAVAEIDSDADGILDGDEPVFGTDASLADTDGDGWLDGDEVTIGTDPLDPNSLPVA